MKHTQTKPTDDDALPDWLELVRQQVDSLRYGVVQITVHDSRVTQVEKTERVRLEHLVKKTNANQ